MRVKTLSIAQASELEISDFSFLGIAMADITTGLVARYKLDDTSGYIARDSAVTEHAPGAAVNFDGVADYITCGTDVGEYTVGFSIAFWVYIADVAVSASDVLVSHRATSPVSYEIYLATFGRVAMWDGVNPLFSANDAITSGVWKHIVASISGAGTLQYYSNGAASGSPLSSAIALNTTATFTIGRRPETAVNYLLGKMADVQLYNYALSAGEVSALYSSSTLPTVPPVSRWQLQSNFNDSGTPGGAHGTPISLAIPADLVDGPGAAKDGILQGGDTFATLTVAGPSTTLTGAVNLDGIADYIDTPGLTAATDAAGGTFSIWCNPTSVTNKTIFGDGATANRTLTFTSTTNLRYVDAAAAIHDITISTSTGVWQHISITRSAADAWKVYFNGANVGSFTLNESLTIAELGRRGSADQYFAGALADARVFSRELAAGDVTALYNLGVDVTSNVSLLDPSLLRAGLTTGANLNAGLTTSSYTGGTPTDSGMLKPSLLDAEGNLKPGLLDANGNLKPSLLKSVAP